MSEEKNDYFSKADDIDLAILCDKFMNLYFEEQKNHIADNIRLSQHLERENRLMNILKKTYPKIYKMLINEDKKGEK